MDYGYPLPPTANSPVTPFLLCISVNPESGTLDQLCNKITRFGHFFFGFYPIHLASLGITWPMKEVIPQQFPQHRIQCTKTKKTSAKPRIDLAEWGSLWIELGEMHVRRKNKDWDGSKPVFLAIFFGNEISMSHGFLNLLGYRVLSQSRGVKTRLLQHWADSSSHWWTVWQVLLATFVGCEEISLPGIAPIAPWFFGTGWKSCFRMDLWDWYRTHGDALWIPTWSYEKDMVFERF